MAEEWQEQLRRQLLVTFREEAEERLGAVRDALEFLASGPGRDRRPDLLALIFRHVHTIKGGARAAGLGQIEPLAHRLEDLLELVRATEADPGAAPTVLPFRLIYEILTAIAGLANVDGAPLPPTSAVDRLSDELETALVELGASPAPRITSARAEDVGPPRFVSEPVPSLLLAPSTLRVPLSRLDQLLAHVNELHIAGGLVGHQLSEVRALEAVARTLAAASPDEAHAQLLHDITHLRAGLDDAARHVAASVAAVHVAVRDLRVVPLTSVLGSFTRLVREAAEAAGVLARFAVEGGDQQFDRSGLDTLVGPLRHLVRNAVDHGLETQEERVRSGKDPIGSVSVRAYEESGMLVIEVADDGRGIDWEAVRLRAAAAGVAVHDDELFDVLLRPGFSTRTETTTLSGRGVGLDVVRDGVESIHGSVEATSELGRGTSFRMLVPFAIGNMRCIPVRSEEQWFALPLTGLVRLQAVEADALGRAGDRSMLRTVEGFVPCAHLSDVLARQPRRDTAPVALVLRTGGRTVALLVAEVGGEMELISTPFPAPLRRVAFASGAAITPTGQPIAVLNAPELARAIWRGGAQLGRATRPTDVRDAPRNSKIARALVVVVADDSITTRALEATVLRQAGYEVRPAADGAQALEILEAGGVDALVSDVQMPGLDGIELCERARADPRFAALPIILVTGLSSDIDRQRGLAAGADAYIVKAQFDSLHLIDVLRSLIGPVT